MTQHPFKNLTILEFASVLAGPTVGMFFAELGATVIKIENKRNGGDVTRSWKTSSENKDHISAYYSSANWGKDVRFLDLTNDDDYQEVLKIVRVTDIIISSFKKGDDVKLRVDYETLKKINPLVIYGHISGYGESSSRTGYDAIVQAESGFMAMNGEADSLPTKMPVALIDILAAHQLKEGILVSLINRYQNQVGDYVHVSLLDSAIASLANQASNFLMTDNEPQRIGSEHPNIVPYGRLFMTKDKKYIMPAIGSDKQFKELCMCLNIADLSDDERFKTNHLRVIHRDIVYPMIEEAVNNLDADEIIGRTRKRQIPCGIVKSLRDVFTDVSDDRLFISNEAKAVKTIAFHTKNIDQPKTLKPPS